MPETWFLLLVAGAFLLGGTVKGTIGLGLPLVAIAFMTTVITVPEALPIASMPILVMNAWQAARGLDWRVVFRRLFLLNLFASIGIAGGALLLFRLDPVVVGVILGASLVVYVAVNLVAFDLHVPPELEAKISPPCGLVGGALFGMTGSLAFPVVPYLTALRMPKDEFVQAVGMVFFLTALVFVGSLAAQGVYTWENTAISFGALIPSSIGMAIGTWLRGKVSEALFRKLVFLFILILGLNLIRQAIF